MIATNAYRPLAFVHKTAMTIAFSELRRALCDWPAFRVAGLRVPCIIRRQQRQKSQHHGGQLRKRDTLQSEIPRV